MNLLAFKIRNKNCFCLVSLKNTPLTIFVVLSSKLGQDPFELRLLCTRHVLIILFLSKLGLMH